MWWLLLLGAGVVVVVVGRRSSSIRTGMIQAIPPAHEIGGAVQERAMTVDVVDRWRCPRTPGAAEGMIPPVEQIVPAEVIAMSGPIGLAIKGGLHALRQIFEAIGKRTCTLEPGQYLVIDRVIAQSARVSLTIELRWRGWPAAWEWSWTSVPVSATGPLTPPHGTRHELVSPGHTYSHEAIDYLGAGGEPRGTTWPHYPIDPDYVSPNPQGYEQPRADVIRSGGDLLLGVWLPARSGKYGSVTWARKGHRHDLERRPRWRIRWSWSEQ